MNETQIGVNYNNTFSRFEKNVPLLSLEMSAERNSDEKAWGK